MSNRPIDPKILQRLGIVISEWTHAEALQAETISHFLHADQGGMYVLTQSVSGKTLTDWIRHLVSFMVTDNHSASEINLLLNEVDGVRAERNTLAHALWTSGSEPGTVHLQTVRWDRPEVVKTEVWSRPDFDDLIDRIRDVRASLIHFERSVRSAVRDGGS